jgi:hypothetical protein
MSRGPVVRTELLLLKTETSFAMFSNLRTEGGTTNHLIVRRGLRLASYQEDLVTILDSSDPELQRLADLEYRLPYFEFRSYLSRRISRHAGAIRVGYRRGETETWIDDATRDPALAAPDALLSRKLLYFRPVPLRTNAECRH